MPSRDWTALQVEARFNLLMRFLGAQSYCTLKLEKEILEFKLRRSEVQCICWGGHVVRIFDDSIAPRQGETRLHKSTIPVAKLT